MKVAVVICGLPHLMVHRQVMLLVITIVERSILSELPPVYYFYLSRSSNISYSNGLFVHRSIGDTHSENSARDIYGVANDHYSGRGVWLMVQVTVILEC